MGLLNSADKEKIKVALPKAANKILDVAVARLYIAYPDPNEWQYTGLSGAVVLVDDLVGHTFFLKLVDIEGHRGVIWDQELYVNFEYHQSRTFFHTFELEECYAGLLFEDLGEASHFLKRINKRERYASKKTLSNKNATALADKAQQEDSDDDFHGPRGETVYGSQRERYNYSNVDSAPIVRKAPPPPPPPVAGTVQNVSDSDDTDWQSAPATPAPVPPPVSTTKHAVPPPFQGGADTPSSPASARPAPPAPATGAVPPQASSSVPGVNTQAPNSSGAAKNKNPFPFPIPQVASPSQITPFPQPPQPLQMPVAFQNSNVPASAPAPASPAYGTASNYGNRPVPPAPARNNRPVPPPPPRTGKMPPPVPPSRRGPAPPPPPQRGVSNGANAQPTGGFGARPPAPPPPRRGPVPPPPPRSSKFTSFSQQQQQYPQPIAANPMQPQQTMYTPPPVSFPQPGQSPSPAPQSYNRPQPPIPPTTFNSAPSPSESSIGAPPPPPPPPPAMSMATGGGPPPPPPPPPSMPVAPPAPAMPAMPSNSGSSGGTAEVTGDSGRDALLASIRGAGGIGSLRTVDKSQLDKPSVLLQEAHGQPAQPASSAPTGGGGGAPGGSLADALAAALNKRKNKVAADGDYDNGDDW